MLEERLREQLEEIRQHESPLKLEILRRVAMADALGAPMNAPRSKLRGIKTRNPQNSSIWTS